MKSATPTDTISGLTAFAEGVATFSDGLHTPFWFVANQYGLGSLQRNNGYLSAGIFKKPNPSHRWTWGVGAEIAVAYRYPSSFYIQQAYGLVQYSHLQLIVGSKEYAPEIIDRNLSSGGLVYSTNARPMPQIRVAVSEYWPLGFTGGMVSVKGHIAYGRFMDNCFQQEFASPEYAYVKDAFYHSKAGFIRIGRERDRFHLEGGLQFFGRFGGTRFNPDGTREYAPHRLSDFLRMLIPLKGDANASQTDRTNVLGDHLGSWLLAVDGKWRGWRAKLYYEHQFEDHSQLFLTYPWKDGLWGGELTFPTNPVVSRLVYEYMISRDQSGSLYHDPTAEIPDQISARDDYLNHGFYQGWQMSGWGIGSPVFFSPFYNPNGSLMLRSTRIRMHHFGILGHPSRQWEYRMLLTLTRHWGTYDEPLQEVSHTRSFFAELSFLPQKCKGWAFRGAFALDRSDWIGDNWGFQIKIRKELRW